MNVIFFSAKITFILRAPFATIGDDWCADQICRSSFTFHPDRRQHLCFHPCCSGMFVFSSVSEDRGRRGVWCATLFNNLTLQVLVYIRRWLGGPQWSQTELDISLALPLVDSGTLGRFLKILLIVPILNAAVTGSPVPRPRGVREIMHVRCSLQGLAWGKLRNVRLLQWKLSCFYCHCRYYPSAQSFLTTFLTYTYSMWFNGERNSLVGRAPGSSPSSFTCWSFWLSKLYLFPLHLNSVRLEDDRPVPSWFSLSKRLIPPKASSGLAAWLVKLYPRHRSHFSSSALWAPVRLLSECKWAHGIVLSPCQSKEVFRLSNK